MQVQYFSSIQLESLQGWVYFSLFRSHPCGYSDPLNKCWTHKTHPSFLELAPIHPFCKAGWRHVAFIIPAHWIKTRGRKENGDETITWNQSQYILVQQPEKCCLKGLSFFSNRIFALVYKKEEDMYTFSFDWTVCVAVNSGKRLLGLRWVAWVQHHRLFQFKKVSWDCMKTKNLQRGTAP